MILSTDPLRYFYFNPFAREWMECYTRSNAAHKRSRGYCIAIAFPPNPVAPLTLPTCPIVDLDSLHPMMALTILAHAELERGRMN